ncbi:MAG: ribonuclease P protein component 1 [Nanoarchaeota archaeon]|nr:ribonuclease P protein component 1 [Nanoarchaeota archaeon]MBU1135264.1 ribonuclease P protein component 1 [Nanoarchaeota archaeon]MBU2519886.1 ribonuclease P protein component 1 [Nanoarchaeota archaeon]
MTGIDPNELVRHELIGLHVKIIDSTDPSVIGMEGRVVDETRNTFIIEKEDGNTKTVVKENCVFSFEYETGKCVKVDGKILVARSEDRLKKKVKKW